MRDFVTEDLKGVKIPNLVAPNIPDMGPDGPGGAAGKFFSTPEGKKLLEAVKEQFKDKGLDPAGAVGAIITAQEEQRQGALKANTTFADLDKIIKDAKATPDATTSAPLAGVTPELATSGNGGAVTINRMRLAGA